MSIPADKAKAEHLLQDLNKLHEQLGGNEPPELTEQAVPLLEDVLNKQQPVELSFEQQMLIHCCEKLLPEIIDEFVPLIANELGKRLQHHLKDALASKPGIVSQKLTGVEINPEDW